MPFYKLKFERISEIIISIEPIPEPLPPIPIPEPTPTPTEPILVETYRGIPIYINSDQAYTFTYSGLNYLYTDILSAKTEIDMLLYVLPPPNPPPQQEPTFIENCDIFDTSKWMLDYGGPGPLVSDGTWILNFPANTEKYIIPESRQLFGYGTYECRFKMSGPKPNSQRYYFYLIRNQPSPDYGELDMFEVNYYEQRQSVSNYNGSEINAIGEYYQGTVDYEDGVWHTWKFEYFPTQEKAYIDEILQYIFQRTEYIPKPPMELLIGGYSDGTGAYDFTMTIDWIKYTPNP